MLSFQTIKSRRSDPQSAFSTGMEIAKGPTNEPRYFSEGHGALDGFGIKMWFGMRTLRDPSRLY